MSAGATLAAPPAGRGLRPAVRIWILNAAMFATCLLLAFTLPGRVDVAPPSMIPVAALLLIFFACERWPAVILVPGGGNAWGLEELPVVVAAVFSTMQQGIIAAVAGLVLAHMLLRRVGFKIVFNCLQQLACMLLAYAVFWHFADAAALRAGHLTAATIGGLYAAGAMVFLTYPFTMLALIVYSGERVFPQMRRELTSGAVQNIVNTSMGLLAVIAALQSPWLALLLLPPAGALMFMMRAFVQAGRERDQLSYLSQSTQGLLSASDLETASVDLLSRACSMFQCRTAHLLLLPEESGNPALRTTVLDGRIVETAAAVDLDEVTRGALNLLAEPEGLRLPRSPDDPRLAAFMRDHQLETGMIARLRVEQRTMGMLCLGNRFYAAAEFSAAELSLLETLAAQTAATIEKGRLQQASAAKTEYLSRMSHELRTPLAAILGFADLLLVRAQQPDDIEGLTAILQAAEHLVGLVNDVLDIARIESGKELLSVEPVDVNAVLEECVALMRPRAEARHIRLETRIAGVAGAMVLADRQRLVQVLLNLISNAVKYDREHGRVTVAASLQDEGHLRIAVHDTGPGISAEGINRLFQPFERLGAERGDVQGTGLGLALTKQLVELMGGHVGVEQGRPQGAVFWIELPRRIPPAVELHGEARAETPVAAAATSPRTILYIEDNAANRNVVAGMIALRPELRLITANDGAAGLLAAQEHCPDLVLLDVQLPDMDAAHVLASLRTLPGMDQVPVIALSADATSWQRERMLAAGVSAYVTKPVRPAKLLKAIDETAVVQPA